MNRLLEILGAGITSDTADLIWHWLWVVKTTIETDPAEQQQWENILKLIRDEKTQAAEGELKLHLFENPKSPAGHLAMAAVLLQQNQVQDAIEQLESVYRYQPNNTMALYSLGHCYERLENEEKAVEFYQDCIKFKNYLQLPRQRLAAIYFKNCQLEKTINEYHALRSEYPDDISTLVTLGYLYVAGEQFSEAIETFNAAILMHPDNFLNTEEDNIEQLLAQDNLQKAIELIENLLEKFPNRADLMVKHADVLSRLGADDDAIEQYQNALTICPDFLEATIKLGTQYLRMHNEDQAAKQFNRAFEINDQIVDAYIGLAIAQKSAGLVDEAMATLSLAAAIQPNSSLLFAETATLQFESAFRDEGSVIDANTNIAVPIEAAIKAHYKQIEAQSQNADLHYRLGILMMSVNRAEQALKSFKIALDINPAYHRARSKMAICLFETDKKQQALEQLKEPQSLDKNSLQLHYKIALLYCDKIKFASSLINLERNMEKSFALAETTVNISIVLQNLGLLDRATAMWDNLSDTTKQAINNDSPF